MGYADVFVLGISDTGQPIYSMILLSLAEHSLLSSLRAWLAIPQDL